MGSAVLRYWPQYKVANVLAMIRNMKRGAKACGRRLDGSLVVITGATSGIGYETSRKYASMGARLLLINRNPADFRTSSENSGDFNPGYIGNILFSLMPYDFKMIEHT